MPEKMGAIRARVASSWAAFPRRHARIIITRSQADLLTTVRRLLRQPVML
jgi:hypothetical protein